MKRAREKVHIKESDYYCEFHMFRRKKQIDI
mgnify:CR=1 FL=1